MYQEDPANQRHPLHVLRETKASCRCRDNEYLSGFPQSPDIITLVKCYFLLDRILTTPAEL
ncbi:hypothetical protein LCGC14_1128240 [marine sediment metagenome]|uniref:Uncharacterized protein n=1 Tax=marine sediment metagenome TaxID=412755 RepID=A0A0F9Q7Q8_9ZZZZ